MDRFIIHLQNLRTTVEATAARLGWTIERAVPASETSADPESAASGSAGLSPARAMASAHASLYAAIHSSLSLLRPKPAPPFLERDTFQESLYTEETARFEILEILEAFYKKNNWLFNRGSVGKLLDKAYVKSWVALLHLITCKYLQQDNALFQRAFFLRPSSLTDQIYRRTFIFDSALHQPIREYVDVETRSGNDRFRKVMDLLLRHIANRQSYIGISTGYKGPQGRVVHDMSMARMNVYNGADRDHGAATFLYAMTMKLQVSRQVAAGLTDDRSSTTTQLIVLGRKSPDSPDSPSSFLHSLQHTCHSIASIARTPLQQRDAVEAIWIYLLGTCNLRAEGIYVPLAYPELMILDGLPDMHKGSKSSSVLSSYSETPL